MKKAGGAGIVTMDKSITCVTRLPPELFIRRAGRAGGKCGGLFLV